MNPDHAAFWALIGEDALAEYDALDTDDADSATSGHD